MPQTGVILQLGMVLAHSCQPWGVGSWCLLLSLGAATSQWDHLLHCFLHAGSCDVSSALVFGGGIVVSLNSAAGQQSESGRAPCLPGVALLVLVLWEG